MEELKAIAILKGRLRELKSARKIVDMQNSQLKLDKPIETIEEALFELEQLNIIVEDKRTLTDYAFTNCNDCENKVDNHFTETCLSCKRYYGCYFKKRN